MIHTAWDRIYFLTCENYRQKFWIQCAITLTQHCNTLLIFPNTVYERLKSTCRKEVPHLLIRDTECDENIQMKHSIRLHTFI